MSNIVQQQAGGLAIPAYLASEFKDTPTDAMGELTPGDLGVPFVKMVHGQSAEAKPNWGGNNEQPLPQGTMFLSSNHTIIPIGTPFIVLCRRVSYIKWIGKPGDGKIAYSTLDRNDPRIVKEDGLNFRKDPSDPTGTKQLPPLVTTYYNFYVLTPFNMEQPHVLSFYRTGMDTGKKLVRAIFQGTNGNKANPYVLKFEFGTPHWEVDGKNSWPQFTFNAAGFASEATMKKAKEIQPLALMMSQAGSGGSDRPAEEPATLGETGSMETDEAPMKNVTPQQQLLQPPAVQQLPAVLQQVIPPPAIIQPASTSALW